MGAARVVARVRRGRWSPASSECSSRTAGTGISRNSSANASELSSLADTPPRSPTAAGLGRPRPPTSRMLLRALLPAMVLVLTAVSMHRQRVEHARLADELLEAAARPSTRGATSSMLGQQPQADASRQCADALQIPQVAMLFLVKGELRHEALWRLWFERAQGLLPTQAASNALCSGQTDLPRVIAACGSALGAGEQQPEQQQQVEQQQQQLDWKGAARGSSGGGAARGLGAGWRPGRRHAGRGADILARQHLFDVYVHPHPNFTGFAPGSLLYGRELPIAERVATSWGTHTLVDAAEALMAAALRNPRNQKFIILSESDLPLYSPEVLYLQLMSEHRSRLNACNTTAGWELDFYRVDRAKGPFLPRHLWRKSSQWFVLNRKHAELVLSDQAVEGLFQLNCYTSLERANGKMWERVCYSDEHYFPTLLAFHGLDNETDCQGKVMDVDWNRVASTSPHPWEYQPAEISSHLIDGLRRPRRPGCGNAAGALAAAPAAFLQPAQLINQAVAAQAAAADPQQLEQLGRGLCRTLLLRQQMQPHYPAVGPECPLLARKFSEGTQKAALMALAPCDSPALVLNDGRCPGEGPRMQQVRRLWWQLAPWLLAVSGALTVLPFVAALAAPLWALQGRLARARQHSVKDVATPLLGVV